LCEPKEKKLGTCIRLARWGSSDEEGRMHWTEGFIAVDWGTTNRRGYLIDADGRMTREVEDDQGILSVPPEGFPVAVEELRAELGDKPMLMAGMIGSNRGWVEATYVACPAGLIDLAERLKWPEPGFVAIVPGVSFADGESADVMRGEEVQILGAVAAGLVPQDCVICHPGTHTKWIRVEGGKIVRFRTVMTGEMFSLLREHSILADLLDRPAPLGPAFEAGVRQGFGGEDLTAELFSVRARVLLGAAKKEDAAPYTSGLLIGADLRAGLRLAGEGAVIAMGRPELTGLFASALHIVGRDAREVDGEEAFLAGARELVKVMQ
jgi:2-dehydro-3-deoxygalactonokinase